MFATSNFARNFAGAAGAAVIAAVCLTVAAVPVSAAETVVASKTVSYGDLNLNSSKGRAALQTRIKSAAREVCQAQTNDLAARTHESRCVQNAIRTANAS